MICNLQQNGDQLDLHVTLNLRDFLPDHLGSEDLGEVSVKAESLSDPDEFARVTLSLCGPRSDGQ